MNIAQQIAALPDSVFDRAKAATAVVAVQSDTLQRFLFPDGSIIALDEDDQVVYIGSEDDTLVPGDITAVRATPEDHPHF